MNQSDCIPKDLPMKCLICGKETTDIYCCGVLTYVDRDKTDW
jgi:hypothetical protein